MATFFAILFALSTAYFAYKWWDGKKDRAYLSDLVDKKSLAIVTLENENQDLSDQLKVYHDKTGQGDKDI